MTAAPPDRPRPPEARPYATPRFLPLDALDPEHRKQDQIGRCAPFTSDRWPDLAKFNPWSIPIAQISLRGAGTVLSEDLGDGLLQVWLQESCAPVVVVVPPTELGALPTPFVWGARRLRGASPGSWRILLGQERARIAWIHSTLPMFLQMSGHSNVAHRLGGYPALHPDLMPLPWQGQGSLKLLLQLTDIADPTRLRAVTVVYESAQGNSTEFDAIVTEP